MDTALSALTGQARVPRPRPVQGRVAFVQLRRSKRRSQSGPLRVQFVPAQQTDDVRRVAFAVPRKVGTAVERNRVRRRLRAIAAEASMLIPAGAYLVGTDQGVRDLSFQELKARMIEAMQRATQAKTR
ncbi:MAG: ribonuclease P protein component [Acidimicrobiales bacterium]|jgi:ribonuclease P protein component